MSDEVSGLFVGSVFEPDVIAAMVEAHRLACAGLHPAVSREVIAKTIITMATAGERDPQKLSQFTILSLQDDLSARRLRY